MQYAIVKSLLLAVLIEKFDLVDFGDFQNEVVLILVDLIAI